MKLRITLFGFIAIATLAIILGNMLSTAVDPKEIQVKIDRPLHQDEQIYKVRAGMKINIRVQVTFEDDRQMVVTKNPETSLYFTDEQIADVAPGGAVTFFQPPSNYPKNVELVVKYKNLEKTLKFIVFPEIKLVPVEINLKLKNLLDRRGENLIVQVGEKVAIQVEVTFSDGSRQDVTGDPQTLFFSGDDEIASVSQNGEIEFLSTRGMPFESAFIVVGYGKEGEEVSEMLNFIIYEKDKADNGN